MTQTISTQNSLHTALLFSNRSLAGHLDDVKLHNISCVPNFLHEQTRARMLEELQAIDLIDAEPIIGQHEIRQHYEYTTSFSEQGLFHTVADALQLQLNVTCEKQLPGYLSTPLEFTDLVAQRYPPTNEGISPHRDGIKYLNIIAVFVLEGQGRFCMCDNRAGDNLREVRNEPGDLLLMRGPGFCGENVQPFHFVDQITTRRTSFALRHYSKTT